MAISKLEADIASYTDADLITLMSFKNENEQEAKAALNVFRKRHSKVLWQACESVCSRFYQSEELRDIVFNNTLLSIYNSNTYDETKGSLYLWMFGIAKHELVNALYELNSEEYSLDPLLIPQTFTALYVSSESDEEIHESYESSILHDAINSLTEREQEVLLTYHMYSDGNKHLPDSVIEKLTEKYNTTPSNLRKIKQRATEKVITFIECNSSLRTVKKK